MTEKKRVDVKAETDPLEHVPLPKEKMESLRILFEEGKIEKSRLVEEVVEVVEMVEMVGKRKVVEEVEEVEDKQTADESPVSTGEVGVAADDDCIPQMDPTLLERVKGL